jgi:hypothetical protein
LGKTGGWRWFFVVKLWWNVWQTWTEDDTFFDGRNRAIFPDLFLVGPVWGLLMGDGSRFAITPPFTVRLLRMGHPVAVKAQTEIEATEPLIRAERIGRHGDT